MQYFEKEKTKGCLDYPRKWRITKCENGPDLNLFQVKFAWMENPRNGKELKRLILESADWVNVVARTPRHKLVMVRQFRVGTGRVTTEIPGGVVEFGEDHRTAASRELLEETGYSGDVWTYLGAVEPNPAIHNNLCHHWLLEDAKLTCETCYDEGEDIVVLEMTPDEIRREIKRGMLVHSLALSALSRIPDLWQRVRPVMD